MCKAERAVSAPRSSILSGEGARCEGAPQRSLARHPTRDALMAVHTKYFAKLSLLYRIPQKFVRALHKA
jgi:hypothetical protein